MRGTEEFVGTLLSQIRYRMRQGVYNELRSVELIAALIPWVPEREIRDLLPHQLEDEQRHYQLLRRRLKELGIRLAQDLDPETQAQTREACREMNLKVLEAYQAHRSRADRGV